MIPYADVDDAETGANIGARDNRKSIYLKNCCVSACSAKCHNPDCDVAVVTNVLIQKEYADVLKMSGVRILHVPFDVFSFEPSYTWALAFYKLCALYHVVREQNYKYYAYMDADVYVQSSFEYIWAECEQNIMLYDFGHGFQVDDYRIIIDEVGAFLGEQKFITHYGGEFFAANAKNAILFSEQCRQVYSAMIEKEFTTTKGDEFILSIVASNTREMVKNASPYIYRFWTGSFRLVSSCYKFNPVTVLHVPAEKEYGMIKLYDKYISKRRVPNNSVVYKILHLEFQSIRTRIGLIVRRLYGLIRGG